MNKANIINELQANMSVLKRSLRQQNAKLLSRYDITAPQMDVLFSLNASTQATTKELAQLLSITPGAISQVIESLVQLGYVDRTVNENDRRNISLKLSPSGKKIVDTIMTDKKLFFHTLLDSLSIEDLTVLLRLQKRLAQHVTNTDTLDTTA